MNFTPPRNKKNQVAAALYFLLAFLAAAFYLLVAYLQNGAFGFPLDDAWIHQVYARNLGTRFEFAFFAGQPSAGSTSPLWSALLSVGYALNLDFRVWTIALGIVFLGASGFMTQCVTNHLTGNAHAANWFAPLFLLFEWHMVWAAASGMEIMLFVFLALVLVSLYLSPQPPLLRGEGERPSSPPPLGEVLTLVVISNPKGGGERPSSPPPLGEGLGVRGLLLGIVAGLLTLTRPEGAVLAALVGLGLLLPRANVPLSQRVKTLALFGVAYVFALTPYLAFNLQTSGALLPNTFYAKAAEYAALTEENFLTRWLRLYRQPLIGAQILLLPGLLFGVWKLAREKKYSLLLPAAWIVLLPLLYAWRLPVEYQFGRYVMPIIPFVIIYGIAGTAALFQKMGTTSVPLRLIRRVWAITLVVLLAVFYLLGANFYAQSVAVIQCEMVAVAHWTREHLPPHARVAVHDIGAQGYFDPRPMLDLAGLVSPEVIPFLRDEAQLKAWMRERGAQYAIFFPTWYPQLAKDKAFEEIFSSRCAVTRTMGEENLKVYRLE